MLLSAAVGMVVMVGPQALWLLVTSEGRQVAQVVSDGAVEGWDDLSASLEAMTPARSSEDDPDHGEAVIGSETTEPRAPAIPPPPDDAGVWAPTRIVDGEPIRWNACEPITYAIVASRAPTHAEAITQQAFDEVSRLSALEFRSAGWAARVPLMYEDLGQADIIVAWTDAHDTTVWDDHPNGAGMATTASVSGEITHATIHLRGGDNELSHDLDVLRHELGHAVGLDHVDDVSEVMHPTAGLAGGYGPGDQRGLWELGASAGCLTPSHR